jgi:hypothetical protein
MLDKLPAEPELRMGLELYYGAFWDLSTCRPLGMSEGPISWLAIDAYATARGLDPAQRNDLQHHIRVMDRAYLEHLGKQREKETKRERAAQPGGVRPKNAKGGRGHRARNR